MSSFKVRPSGVGQLLTSEDMQKLMRQYGAKVLARAESTAPVYREGPHPGRYKRSFRLSSGVKQGRRGRRAYARVTNDSPEARPVEYGTKNNLRYRTLGKALDAARG